MKTLKKIGLTILVAILMIPHALYYAFKKFGVEFVIMLGNNIESFAEIWE